MCAVGSFFAFVFFGKSVEMEKFTERLMPLRPKRSVVGRRKQNSGSKSAKYNIPFVFLCLGSLAN